MTRNSLTATNVTVSTSGAIGIGASAQDAASLIMNGGTITTTGEASTGLLSSASSTKAPGPPASPEDPPLLVSVAGPEATDPSATPGASLTANGVTVTTSGARAHGALVRGANQLTLGHSTIHARGADANALHATAFDPGASTATVKDSTLQSTQGAGIGVSGTTLNATLGGSTVSGGAAALQVTNNGTLNLSAASSRLTGPVLTEAGSTSNLTLAGSTWNLTGNSSLTNLTLDGSQVQFSAPAVPTATPAAIRAPLAVPPASAFKTLTVSNYTGAGGTIGLNTVLEGDGAASDKLVISGGMASGTTGLRVANAGGAGALTTANGILVVDAVNGGTTAPGAFALDGRTVAGVYEYRLFRGSADGSAPHAWYLRSEHSPNPPAPRPLYRPEIAAYLANQRLAGQMFVHSLHDRLGEPGYVEGQGFNPAADQPRSGWLRMVGKWEGSKSRDGNFKTTTDAFLLHGGAELAKWSLASEADRLHAGLMGSYGNAGSDAQAAGNPFRAKGKVEGWSVGAYGTWYQNEERKLGAYVDTWFQYGWFNNRVEGDLLPAVKYHAQGWSASGEAGYAIPLRDDWIVEPQAQLIYVDYREGDITEPNGTRVSGADSSGWIARVGVRLHRTFVREDARKVQPYATVNWWHTSTDSSISFNQLPLGSLYPQNRYALKLGVNGDLGRRWTGWADVSGAWGEQSFYQYAVRAGVKYTW
jgi:outer membrane autotransporter protein